MGPFQYIGVDGQVHDTVLRSKPLTRDEARLARKLLMEGADKAGRPIDCRVVTLAAKPD
jgi:hypothetical protein